MFNGFTAYELDSRSQLFVGELPGDLRYSQDEFEILWNLHPASFHEIKIHGRLVEIPRWQQAYGEDYHYTGRVNKALPILKLLGPVFDWSQREIAAELNGALVNWYEGKLGHYIGKHRDITKNMVEGAPIVTISLGEKRTFRLRPWKQGGFRDFTAKDGTVFVMPYATNLAWTHEVPKSTKLEGRRISITLRAFKE